MLFKFETIDMKTHSEICFEFRKDSYFLSFESYAGFEAEMRNYNDRMQHRIRLLPQGNCHLWLDDQIIGQTEMKLIEETDVGYVSFLYLTPEYRNQGLGKLLHQHAVEVFSGLGKSTLQLSVSRSNKHALSFYEKHGWVNSGPRAGKEHMFLMTYAL